MTVAETLTLRGRAAVFALFCGHGALSLMYDALPPVLVQLAKNFGGGARGELVAQFASSLPFLGIMIAGLLADYPVRWWGIRKVLLVTSILFGILGSAGAVIDQAWLLLASRLLLGLAVGTMVSCCLGYVAVAFDDVFRARMTGWLLAFGCFSGVTFILISGYVASIFGWKTPFLLHGVISILFLVPILCMKDDPVPTAHNNYFADLSRMKSTFAVFACAIVLQGISATFNIQSAFLIGRLPFGDPSTIGIVFAVTATAAAVSAFSYSRWFVEVSPPIATVWGFVLLAAGMAIAARAWSFEAFVLSSLIYGTGTVFAQAALFTWAMRTAPTDLAIKAMGLMFTSLYLGAGVGPPLTSPLSIMMGTRNLLWLLVAVILVGIVAATLVARQRRRRALLQSPDRT